MHHWRQYPLLSLSSSPSSLPSVISIPVLLHPFILSSSVFIFLSLLFSLSLLFPSSSYILFSLFFSLSPHLPFYYSFFYLTSCYSLSISLSPPHIPFYLPSLLYFTFCFSLSFSLSPHRSFSLLFPLVLFILLSVSSSSSFSLPILLFILFSLSVCVSSLSSLFSFFLFHPFFPSNPFYLSQHLPSHLIVSSFCLSICLSLFPPISLLFSSTFSISSSCLPYFFFFSSSSPFLPFLHSI